MSQELDSAALAVLRDPGREPRPAGVAEQAKALLRGRVVERIARTLADRGLEALLVKGAALALTVYRDPAARPMGDIDLLVREADAAAVVRALVADGAAVSEPEGRPATARFFGEIVTRVPIGPGSDVTQPVEIHTTLDKIVRRPIDLEGLFARAATLAHLPALRAPSREDHLLLVAQHAAGHELRHPVAWLDLELLLRRGLDLDLVAARARAFRLRTALYAALRGLADLGGASVTEAMVTRFDPGLPRRLAIDALLGEPGPAKVGLAWVLRQAAFHDDHAAYARDVARYAFARAGELLRER